MIKITAERVIANDGDLACKVCLKGNIGVIPYYDRDYIEGQIEQNGRVLRSQIRSMSLFTQTKQKDLDER